MSLNKVVFLEGVSHSLQYRKLHFDACHASTPEADVTYCGQLHIENAFQCTKHCYCSRITVGRPINNCNSAVASKLFWTIVLFLIACCRRKSWWMENSEWPLDVYLACIMPFDLFIRSEKIYLFLATFKIKWYFVEE